MWKFNDSNRARSQSEGGGSRYSGRSRRRVAIFSIAVAGGLLVTAQAMQSPEAHALGQGAGPSANLGSAPGPGSTWVEGVITDSCGQGQDDVNVEACRTVRDLPPRL